MRGAEHAAIQVSRQISLRIQAVRRRIRDGHESQKHPIEDEQEQNHGGN